MNARTNVAGKQGVKHPHRARRIIALVLTLAISITTIPIATNQPASVAQAISLGDVYSAAKKYFSGDSSNTTETVRNEDAEARASEAEKTRSSLANDGTVKKVRLSSAKVLATAQSEKIESLDIQVDAKTAKMQSSVRSLRERERSMQTIRWSPIFNIKFPTKPNEVEAFEFQFKPQQLQNEITLLKHKITETQLDINEKVSNTYIKIIAAEDEVSTLEARYKKLQNTVGKMEVKVKDGSAALTEGRTETDADGNEVPLSQRTLKARYKAAVERLEKAEARLANCEVELTNARTKLEEAKQSLSNQIGLDVTSGYTFEDAFVTANLTRENVEYLYTYALTDDANVYEAQVANDEALLSLRLNYNLMKTNYPRYIGTIEQYIQQALEGEKINKKSFKADYDKFLKQVDEPWQGSYKIWFISIPKEWLKGDLDGIRYVEDDPYVLYTAALEYEAASKELANAKSDLHNQIFEEYGTYAASRKTYLAANEAYIKGQKLLGLDEVSYLLGELTEEEFETEESEFETLKDDAADALSDFSETLYSFDRTTCGGLSKFFEGSASASSGNTEALSLVPVIRRGCIYTLRPIIDSQEFLLSIDVPDDFYPETGINITAFELYADGIQIGERTEVGKTLRHLMVSVEDLGECAIRVYDGNTFVDECRIDPTVFSGPLNITIGYEEESDGHTIGTYTASDEVATDMLVLTLNFDQTQVKAEYESGEEAAYYRICVAQDNYLISDRLVPVDEQFTYLNFLRGDLENVFIEIFDANMVKIGDAKFDTSKKEIYHDVDEETAAAIAEKKRQEAIQRAIDAENAAALAEEQERRETAMRLLAALGFATNRASVNYALEHLNELTAAVELKGTQSELRNNCDTIQEQYEKMKDDPTVPAEDLAAVEKYLELTGKMVDVYENTLGGATGVMLDELEHAAERYVKQCVAEYAANYQLIMAQTERMENGEKLTDEEQEELDAAKERNAEIKLDLAEFNNDAIEEYEKAILPFDLIIKKIYALTGEEIAKSPDTLIDLCKQAQELIEKMSETGGAERSTSRLKTAVQTVFNRLGRYWDDLTEGGYDIEYDMKSLTDERYETIQKTDTIIGSLYQSLRDMKIEITGIDRAGVMLRFSYIHTLRVQELSTLNAQLENKYDLMKPIEDIMEDARTAQFDVGVKQEALKKAQREMERNPGVPQYQGQYDVAKYAVGISENKFIYLKNTLLQYETNMADLRDDALEVCAEIASYGVEPKPTEAQIRARYDEVMAASRETLEKIEELKEQAKNVLQQMDKITAEELTASPKEYRQLFDSVTRALNELNAMFADSRDVTASLQETLKQSYNRLGEYWNANATIDYQDVYELTNEIYQALMPIGAAFQEMERMLKTAGVDYVKVYDEDIDDLLAGIRYCHSMREIKLAAEELSLHTYYDLLKPITELKEEFTKAQDELTAFMPTYYKWERSSVVSEYEKAAARKQMLESRIRWLNNALYEYGTSMEEARDKALAECAEIEKYHVTPSITEDAINARYEEVLKATEKLLERRPDEFSEEASALAEEMIQMSAEDIIASPEALQSKFDGMTALLAELESLLSIEDIIGEKNRDEYGFPTGNMVRKAIEEIQSSRSGAVGTTYFTVRAYWVSKENYIRNMTPEQLTDEEYQKFRNLDVATSMLEAMQDAVGNGYAMPVDREACMAHLEACYEARQQKIAEMELMLTNAYESIRLPSQIVEELEAAQAEFDEGERAMEDLWSQLETVDQMETVEGRSEADEAVISTIDALWKKQDLRLMKITMLRKELEDYVSTMEQAAGTAVKMYGELMKYKATPSVSEDEFNARYEEVMAEYKAFEEVLIR